MAITIGSSNISSLQAQKSLSDATSKVAKAYQQLSSGLRINQASDDAAGLAIATQLNSKARVFNQAIRNVNDGVSAASIAEGALTALKDISTRQLELAEEAANGTYSQKQRQALNAEAGALTDEYNRIVSSTSFNGQNIFDPKLGTITIQAGYGKTATLQLGFSDQLQRTVGDGSFTKTTVGPQQVTTTYGDVNGDGKIDLVTSDAYSSSIDITFGNGDGTFGGGNSLSYSGIADAQVGDFNADGKLDILANDPASGSLLVLLGNGNGTFASPISYTGLISDQISVGDFNNDGKLDIAERDSGQVRILLGNGDGHFKQSESAPVHINGSGNSQLYSTDANNDGLLDLVFSSNDGVVSTFLGRGDGSLEAAVTSKIGDFTNSLAFGDFNGDGFQDIAAIGADDDVGNTGAPTFKVVYGDGRGGFSNSHDLSGNIGDPYAVAAADFNGDGLIDIAFSNDQFASVFFNSGSGSFTQSATIETGTARQLDAVDLNGDGAVDLLLSGIGQGQPEVLLAHSTTVTSESHINIASQPGARAAIDTVTKNLNSIEAQLGSLGATGSRFQTALNNLQVQSQNFEAAASRIQDADVAQESSVLVRTQILQQAAASVLAQANQQPALALKLLS